MSTLPIRSIPHRAIQQDVELADTIQPEHSRSRIFEKSTGVNVRPRDNLQVAKPNEEGQQKQEDEALEKSGVENRNDNGKKALLSFRSHFKAFSH